MVGLSRGLIHIRIGNEHPDSLITYPDVHNLSACAQPIRIMPRRWGCGSWRCLQIVVWLGLATRSKESAGVEGAGGTGRPGCGARGRWRGLAGLRDDAQARVSTPGPTGVEGAGGSGGHGRASRSTTPSEARVWRSRGRPGPPAPGTPAEPQATPSMRLAAAHGAARPHGRAIRCPERQRAISGQTGILPRGKRAVKRAGDSLAGSQCPEASKSNSAIEE